MPSLQTPLAERMRPKTLTDYVGQKHITGKDAPLYKLIKNKQNQSIIFWGPPGVGKTTLAQIIASEADLPFYSLSAIESGVKEVRSVIEIAKKQGQILLFIDEIHRFNKAQQDSLLGAIEKGYIVLIGATTENPSFEVINALLSRCQIYVLEQFSKAELMLLVQQAIAKDEILQQKKITVEEWDNLLQYSGGDGRKILNLLELIFNTTSKKDIVITNDLVKKIVIQNISQYDKNGELHYDIISAFIKSIRGSDPNAAVYYLARMIAGGEDPKFIARRMVILASEDIGNANPNALLLATTTFQAVQLIGWPESRIILSQCATYLASSPKSNAAYEAINTAQSVVKKTGDLPVPLEIRNAPTGLMKDLDYGKNYKYAHSYENNFVPMEFMPEGLKGVKLYDPGTNAAEDKMRAYLRACWKEKYGY
ncbi:MAG: AAA family ATPase [Bacteroidetes bacterium 47-18]|nr:MAG: AAA family ATPase [Bacteroidetes bacterium 47-18]